jgi:hypothetical protein
MAKIDFGGIEMKKTVLSTLPTAATKVQNTKSKDKIQKKMPILRS